MEKLSKLLNEYLESQNKDIQQFMNIAALMTQSDSKLYQTYIISKNFGFIKWLVDNDKIKFYKGKFLEYPIGSNNYDECDYLDLIQWLAISDTPIDDLIYYLK